MNTDANASEVRALLDSWSKAVVKRDVPAILAFYADDIVSFDAIGPLRFVGKATYGKHWADCMQMCQGEMIFEVGDWHIETGGDIAFAHSLLHCGGTGPDGKTMTSWMRLTSCCRRTNGKWQIVHEHFSMPIDMTSGKVLTDLQP